MIHVVEVKRNRPYGNGSIIHSMEFKTWKSAWKFFEQDLLHSRDCPETTVYRYGTREHPAGVIQHWGNTVDEATHICPERTNEINQDMEATLKALRQ